MTINHTPGICGGRACIGDHRITVWLVAQCFQHEYGRAQRVLDMYHDRLTPAEIAEALAYYVEHPDEIEQDIADNVRALEAFDG